MLDFMKLAQQMQDISEHLAQEANAARHRVERAEALMAKAQANQAELVEQHQVWRDRLGFAAASPIEPLDNRINLQSAPEAHTVIAADGSQIAPSHHEIAYCYLINVGRVGLHYGQSRYPILDNLPEIVYRPDDLYISRQWGIRTEEWMGYRRTVSEAVGLAELAQEMGDRREGDREEGGDRGEGGAGEGEQIQNPKSKIQNPKSPHPIPHPPSPILPTLAMIDGSLIYWFLEQLPAEARDRILLPILQSWEYLRSVGIPLVGYLSASRSGEALNFLRLESCPFEAPDCLTHCLGQTEKAPCQVFNPLRDVTLWAILLQPGQRSPLWRSSADILNLYGEHTVYFCYIHVGSEVARVEMPAWVVQEPTLLETALSLTLTQVQKGYGYPVALAEAHNQAVVRGGDRARFFALLEQQMIRVGLKNIGASYKETRKRGSIA